MIRLDKLLLHNFRCFDDCEIGFQPDLTVLVARNGQGKTALLDAVALALGLFVDTVAGTSQWHGFSKRDVRRVRNGEQTLVAPGYVEFQAEAEIEGHTVSWRRWMRSDAKRAITSTKEATELTGVSRSLRDRLESKAIEAPNHFEIPLIAYYGSGRRWHPDRAKPKRPTDEPVNERCIGYVDCLDSSATYAMFSDWYEATFQSVAEAHVVGISKANRPELLLAAVNQAVNSVLEPETGWRDLHWDRDDEQLVLQHPAHGHLPLAFLSEGIRNTVALVADVAHRCARLNPHLGENAAHMTPGILLIDEVDLHLHPEWQQSIIRMLGIAFPHLQLVVSTHSPQVLSTVDVSAIRVVRFLNGSVQVSTPQFQTKGVESADVLAAIMGVDPVPKVPEAKWLSDYRALIEEGQQDEEAATSLKERLLEHFGQQHPLMLECDRLIRFSQFKRRRSAEGGENAQA